MSRVPRRPDIDAAAGRLAGLIRRTPIIEIDPADVGLPPCRLALKLELTQHSGSFKARGATHSLLAEPVPEAGVVAASGGNHGAAVAFAAHRLGVPAAIFVPEISSPAKLARLRSFQPDLHIVPGLYADALAAAQDHQQRTGARPVHAYDDPVVLAGAGTLGRELDHQLPELDTVLVSCGGGGLAAGIAAWFGPSVRLLVVETEGTPTYARARAAGRPVKVEISGVAADALGASQLGEIPFAALTDVDAPSVLVDDEAVIEAQAVLWDRLRLATEPAAAAPLAALRTGAYRPEPDERVVVVVCGANLDPAALA